MAIGNNKARRWRPKWSIRALLLAVATICVVLALLVKAEQERQVIIREIQSNGGEVVFEPFSLTSPFPGQRVATVSVPPGIHPERLNILAGFHIRPMKGVQTASGGQAHTGTYSQGSNGRTIYASVHLLLRERLAREARLNE